MLSRKIVSYSIKTLNDTDLNLWIVEPILNSKSKQNKKSFLHNEDRKILNLLSGKEKQTVLVLNKIDRIGKEKIISSIAEFSKIGDFAEIVPISALKSTNVKHLVKIIKKYLPAHPFYFEENQFTDVSERFLAGEFVREEIFIRLHKEIPYSVAVIVEKFKNAEKCAQIACTICVERESQKGIIIGEKGQMLRKIGISARKKIEKLLGRKVNLFLHVKVLKKWSQNTEHLISLGYN